MVYRTETKRIHLIDDEITRIDVAVDFPPGDSYPGDDPELMDVDRELHIYLTETGKVEKVEGNIVGIELTAIVHGGTGESIRMPVRTLDVVDEYDPPMSPITR